MSSVADPEWFIPDPDPALNFPSSESGYNLYYLSIFGNYKKHLKFNQKEESTNYLLFSISYYTKYTVLQYTQSRIHKPKMRYKIFIDLLFHFLLDPEQ